MALSNDTWLKEFDEAMKLADEIHAKIQQRNEMLRARDDPSRLVAATRRKVTMLSTKSDRMEFLLKNPSDKVILSEKEIRRREDMLLGIRYKTKQMANMLNSSQTSNRTALIGRDGKPLPSVETEFTAGLDNRGVVQLQHHMMQEQDEELAGLENTVSSTKHIALAINGELDLHARLLDELDGDVESTNSRLKNAQKKLVAVSKRANKTCNMLYIMSLIVGIAIVLIVLVKLAKIF